MEKSLRLAKPKALIQMATGSGKTFTAANVAYRLHRPFSRIASTTAASWSTLGGRPSSRSRTATRRRPLLRRWHAPAAPPSCW
ncbi:MAG: DEAD/DEAH box helicase family protein, partial [bacterium]